MTYGIDPDDPSADLLEALMAERYGDIRDLERERFTLVPTRPKRTRPRLRPIGVDEANHNALTLAAETSRDANAHEGITA